MSSALTIVNWCPGDACDPCKVCHWIPDTFTIPGTYKISHPGHADDGAIDQIRTFCGAPVWGIGLTSTSPGATPGTLVNGTISLTCGGQWATTGKGVDFFGGTVPFPTAPPLWPPVIPIRYEGSTVFTLDASAGAISGFAVVPHTSVNVGDGFLTAVHASPYCAFQFGFTSLLTFANCVMLDPVKDKITSPYDCVLPYTGPIPDPVFAIAPTRPDSGDGTIPGYTESTGYPPGVLWNSDENGIPIYNFTIVKPDDYPTFMVYMRVNNLIDP